MCPVCLFYIALTAAGASSGGGLAALVLNKLCRNKLSHKLKGENETSRTRIETRDRVRS